MFTTPPVSLSQRNRFFGLRGRWNSMQLRALNAQVAQLSRVVLHPTFRGAGIASAFIRRSCELCPYPWIETLTRMGHVNPFFEKAGFVRVGQSSPPHRSHRQHSAILGGQRKTDARQTLVTRETHEKSRHGTPVYYVFDNRANQRPAGPGPAAADA